MVWGQRIQPVPKEVPTVCVLSAVRFAATGRYRPPGDCGDGGHGVRSRLAYDRPEAAASRLVYLALPSLRHLRHPSFR